MKGSECRIKGGSLAGSSTKTKSTAAINRGDMRGDVFQTRPHNQRRWLWSVFAVFSLLHFKVGPSLRGHATLAPQWTSRHLSKPSAHTAVEVGWSHSEERRIKDVWRRCSSKTAYKTCFNIIKYLPATISTVYPHNVCEWRSWKALREGGGTLSWMNRKILVQQI